jgi:polar amino acid transport system substrate-binding protein
MRSQIKFVVLIMVCLGLFLGIHDSAIGKEYASKLDEVLDRGYIIIGTSSASAPFGFIDKKTGELVGFDIDIGKLLAKAIFKDETKVKFVKQSFEARWASVQTGKTDCGIQTTTIYPERALKVAFTRRYIDSGIGTLVQMDSPLQHLEDLNNEKYTLANLNNPQQAERAKRFVPKAKVLTFSSITDQFMALQTGRADAAQLDTPVAGWYTSQFRGKYRVLPELMSDLSNNAIFLRKGDFQWWLTLDTIVREMLEGTLHNNYKEIYQKWFATDPPLQRWYLKK